MISLCALCVKKIDKKKKNALASALSTFEIHSADSAVKKKKKMKFIELVNKRQSTRKYSSAPISRNDIDLCVEASRMAPSACNAQPYSFVVVDEPDLKNKVASETCGLLDKLA